MHNLVFVEDSNGKHELAGIELDLLLGEALDLEEIGVEVAAPDELEEEVDSVVVLKDIVHAQQKGVLGLQQDVPLVVRVVYLPLLDQDILPDSLHGV